MTQGRKVTFALVALDIIAVVVAYNFVAWLRGLGLLSDSLRSPLPFLVLMHMLALYLIDGYSRRTDMMSVTYTSLHTIALVLVMLCTLLLTYAFIPAGFSLQTSRLVTVGAYLLLVPTHPQLPALFLPTPASPPAAEVFPVPRQPGKLPQLQGGMQEDRHDAVGAIRHPRDLCPRRRPGAAAHDAAVRRRQPLPGGIRGQHRRHHPARIQRGTAAGGRAEIDGAAFLRRAHLHARVVPRGLLAQDPALPA